MVLTLKIATLALLGTEGAARSYGIGRTVGLMPRIGAVDLSRQGHPGLPNVTRYWYTQTIDHFSWAPTPTGERTFQQRYMVNRQHWKTGGPIFLYTGNEANVEMYVNSTGLMWENAEEFGAALVWVEHRYYGDSKPFGENLMKYLQYLTMEQALADYASFIYDFKSELDSQESRVIAFGGSYGGMLAAWLRVKYPNAVDGAIAGSAPVLAFRGQDGHLGKGGRPFGSGEAYWDVVTRDATEAGGSVPSCAANVRRSWQHLFDLGKTAAGRRKLAAIFRLCGDEPLKTAQDVTNLALMHLNAWDTMAMGNFPYPSNYLIFQATQDPSTLLPAYPVRVACQHLVGDFSNEDDLLAGVREASGVLYNASKVQCYELPSDPNFDGIWDYQWCTEMLPQETYFSRDGTTDMFWRFAENLTDVRRHCNATFGVEPRETWIAREFGALDGATNIVFSNGLFDPWSSGGVVHNISESAVAVIIPEGAHHLDLFFSNPSDPPSVVSARLTELNHIRSWISAPRHESAILPAYV